MSACRRQNSTQRRQTSDFRTVQSAHGRAAEEPPVRRYVHPIQTARPCRRVPAEELLAQLQASLARQTALLEELLRRTGGNGTDTN